MKKDVKLGTCIIFCCIMFLCGFLISKQVYSHRYNSLENMKQLEKDVYEWVPTLADEDIEFLEEHLFGQWRFSERIAVLEKEQSDYLSTKFNISNIGVEELKYNYLMKYTETFVGYTPPLLQDMFSDPQDMFLFGECGGFQWARNPIYTIEKMETNVVELKNINFEGDPTEAIPTDGEKLIKISYRTQIDDRGIDMQRRSSTNFANTIYVVPSDKDTIYVEFCGLWRMERDDIFYRGGRKNSRG